MGAPAQPQPWLPTSQAEATFKQLSEAYTRLSGHGRGGASGSAVHAAGPGYAGAYRAAQVRWRAAATR